MCAKIGKFPFFLLNEVIYNISCFTPFPNILFSFSALSAHFKDLHLFNFNEEELEASKERLTPTAKRITEGWITYSLVEIMQRYGIRGAKIIMTILSLNPILGNI